MAEALSRLIPAYGRLILVIRLRHVSTYSKPANLPVFLVELMLSFLVVTASL